MDIHLDPVGGVAGDMFVAAVLDAFPQLEAGMLDSIAAVAPAAHVTCRLERHRDHVLQGARFIVEEAGHAHRHAHGHDHHHASWRGIREALWKAPLSPAVRDHAVGIFTLLADAEARVHGVPPEEVTFHEVGAADSIADIVGAAHLVASLGVAGWSTAPLPLGAGRVQTQHGPLPVPAPATALLLQGLPVHDDRIPGERVTPTGAAILRHLRCAAQAPADARIMAATGIGFGARRLPGLPNCLRLLALEPPAAEAEHRELAVIEFEVDDQSPEELALGLERLRAEPAILDALQMPAVGKKGRLMAHLQVLARGAEVETAIAACFRETTTIGLRHRRVGGAALRRRSETVEVDGHAVRVKVVERCGRGETAKAEIDDAAAAGGSHAERTRLRQRAERAVLGE
jgi:pyridinium-3,5-bisthiocarboxylic acid mononucleotide nickel chelatase